MGHTLQTKDPAGRICENGAESDTEYFIASSILPNRPEIEQMWKQKVQMISLCFGCVLIVIIPALYFLWPITIFPNNSGQQGNTMVDFPNFLQPPGIVEIKSVADLNRLEGVETIVISSLEQMPPSSNNYNPQSDVPYRSVKNVTIAGPVSADWIEYLIGSFKSITHLSIDLAEVCINITMDDPLNHPALTLGKCESFEVLNSKSCYLESWIYRWQFPRLKKLNFKNVDINKRNCKQVNKLLSQSGSSFIMAHFQDCNFFKCNLSTQGETSKFNLTIEKTSSSDDLTA